MERTKFVLAEKEMPTSWYNILPDLPEPLPPVLHPGTGQSVTPDDLVAYDEYLSGRMQNYEYPEDK